MTCRTQRLRDPVHGLIAFDKHNPIDQLAWKLINVPEFQRLRRIKQLGVSEFVFPGASHSRFAHSIGVFHTARELVRIIKRETGSAFKRCRADIAITAALLHDLGHGPFSHTFEQVQKSRHAERRHEKWTADIIRNEDGAIRPLLEEHRAGFTEEVARLLAAEFPSDIYHAVVSSSFDADRLDYLRRDRLMTGTGAGAIDFDWLMDHVRVAEIVIDAIEDDSYEESTKISTFCFDSKALPAAEQFLLSRCTLHEQVYFHKTTRSVEAMIAKLLRQVAEVAMTQDNASAQTGLEPNHVLLRFFAPNGETIRSYLALDDFAIIGSLQQMRRAVDPLIADLAARLDERRLYKTLDIGSFGSDFGKQRKAARSIDQKFEVKLKKGEVIKDEAASFSVYTPIGGDDDKMHKKLHVLDAGQPREITEMSKMIQALVSKHQLTRYYFAKASDREAARKIWKKKGK